MFLYYYPFFPSYLSSLFISLYLSVFNFFLAQAQFVFLLIITNLSFLSSFICQFYYALILCPFSFPPLPLLMCLFVISETLILPSFLSGFSSLHIKLSLALSFSVGRANALSHTEPLCTCLFYWKNRYLERAICLYHIKSVQFDTDRQIIG